MNREEMLQVIYLSLMVLTFMCGMFIFPQILSIPFFIASGIFIGLFANS